MKKNLLFVMPSLSAGGGEKSLINLLSQIDYNLYNVDLFLFNKQGVLVNQIPSEVKILELAANYRTYTRRMISSVIHFLKNGQFHLAYSRIIYTAMNRMMNNMDISEQYSWKYIAKSHDAISKEYDAAIGYLEKSSIYFLVEKVRANKKIGWIHTNYSSSSMDYRFDYPYFEQLDYMVTVSKECAESLKENFKNLKGKVRVIHNIIAPEVIKSLAEDEIQDDFILEESFTNIVTIGRLSHEKGIDIAVEACRQLIGKGLKVRWYVLGSGSELKKLEKMIKKYGLDHHFKLLGFRENPYPYIKRCDIYVQPSRYEGKSIAIDEAKILSKPIIVTNFSTAKDQITDGVDGLIVEMSARAIAEGIGRLIQEKDFRCTLEENLSRLELGTEKEVNKLYQLLT
ncbi:glycosyltransferase [Ferviditalea candida]|uniref:Glycosyltransferase n=1 Tax=Ferviditalea candida TaxID=3108399 RepID=A0ABU5ZF03_9BACL|nr:glycosyltransferase [Paenibacillaceae bacterium T2]